MPCRRGAAYAIEASLRACGAGCHARRACAFCRQSHWLANRGTFSYRGRDGRCHCRPWARTAPALRPPASGLCVATPRGSRHPLWPLATGGGACARREPTAARQTSRATATSIEHSQHTHLRTSRVRPGRSRAAPDRRCRDPRSLPHRRSLAPSRFARVPGPSHRRSRASDTAAHSPARTRARPKTSPTPLAAHRPLQARPTRNTRPKPRPRKHYNLHGRASDAKRTSRSPHSTKTGTRSNICPVLRAVGPNLQATPKRAKQITSLTRSSHSYTALGPRY